MDARAVAHRRRAALPGPASAGTMDVAHSRTVRVSENPGIMRKSGFSGSRNPAPMCAVPPQRTWEPGNRARQSTGKRMIPPKTLPRPAKAPPSHVQHQRQPHPKHAPTTPRTEIGPIQPDQPDVEARTTSSRAKTTCHTSGTVDKQHTRGSTTDLGTGYDRSRAEVRPISTRNRTDLGEGRAEGRAGPRAARPLGVGRRRREETATPPPLVLFPCQAREMREASSTCSGVGRTPV